MPGWGGKQTGCKVDLVQRKRTCDAGSTNWDKQDGESGPVLSGSCFVLYFRRPRERLSATVISAPYGTQFAPLLVGQFESVWFFVCSWAGPGPQIGEPVFVPPVLCFVAPGRRREHNWQGVKTLSLWNFSNSSLHGEGVVVVTFLGLCVSCIR